MTPLETKKTKNFPLAFVFAHIWHIIIGQICHIWGNYVEFLKSQGANDKMQNKMHHQETMKIVWKFYLDSCTCGLKAQLNFEIDPKKESDKIGTYAQNPRHTHTLCWSSQQLSRWVPSPTAEANFRNSASNGFGLVVDLEEVPVLARIPSKGRHLNIDAKVHPYLP